MNVFELYAKISLDTKDYSRSLNDASKQTNNLGESIKKGFKTAGKVAAVGLGAITAAVGVVAKKSLDAYADYEQLVGGIETLFGAGGKSVEEFAKANGKSVDEVRDDYEKLMDSQETVLKNAKKAYKSAGMSANEYMETVTGFSASLLQSLGNDTKAAAEYADMAVTDMSDNANKMGTDMSLIQNAYQGFAKSNFTMLDNLKLGYGGTQKEMQRLIDDANRVKEANGEMADLSIDSFADVTEAIHIIQNEMGITGTTASEASSTIQGSLATAKSAWENLLVAFGDGNADLGQEVDDFVESVGTAAGNIIPRIGEILSGIGELIPELVPIIVEEIPGLIESLLPPILDGMGQIVAALVENAPEIFMALVNAISDTLATIGDSLAEQIPALSPIFENLQAVVVGATAAFIAFKVAMAISSLIEKVKKGIDAYKQANEGATTSQALLNQVMNANPFVLIVTIIASLVAAIITLWNTNEDFRNAVQEIWEAIKGFFVSAWETIQQVWSTVVGFFTGIWEGIQGAFAAVGEWFSEKFEAARAGVQQAWETVTGFFSGIWQGIQGAFSAVGEWFSNIFETARDGIQRAWSGVTGFFGGIWSGIQQAFGSVASWFQNIFSTAWQAVKNVFSTGGKVFEGIKEGIVSVFKTVVNAIIRGINKVVAIPFNAINGFLDFLRNVNILGFEPFSWVGSIAVPQIPLLEKGGVLKRGQVGVLEGNGAEAVVPLEKNTGWIKNVAGEMAALMSKETDSAKSNSVLEGATININVNGAKIQNDQELAERISFELRNLIDRRAAAFA